MKRGSRFFIEYSTADHTKGSDKRGRNADMLLHRNEKIFHRYYYYARLLLYGYEAVLLSLVLDFDLSESTLMQLLEKNTDRLKEIAELKLTRRQLRSKFPSFDWNGRAFANEENKEKVHKRLKQSVAIRMGRPV
jgi:hypothetical protein